MSDKFIIDSGEDWTFEKIHTVNEILAKQAKEKYGLDTFPNQLEIVSYEQMLDCYASVGLPIMYDHWSYGEAFLQYSTAYKKNHMGLAYEMVLNSNPCISYLMEQNTMLMQALVIAHAAYGHNHVYKNNFLFKEWTDPEGILDYMTYAKKYIKKCEEKYGLTEVESILDAAHALKLHGIDRYKRPSKLSIVEEEKRKEERDRYLESQINELWNFSVHKKEKTKNGDEEKFPKEPQENILYFLEKNAPRLETWQREILRIVRKVAQYFYPQLGGQTSLIHEGAATFFHYNLMRDLYDMGHITDGGWQEFIVSHTGVIRQDDHAARFNVYALGFAMFQDIERLSTQPTQEDKNWFKGQQWVGNNDPYGNIRWAIANFRDESFILQFLSPTVMRRFKMFTILDNEELDYLEVTGIQNEEGYKLIRKNLASLSDISNSIPNISIIEVDRWGDRSMVLEHTIKNGKLLHDTNVNDTLNHLAYLWQYPVLLQSITRTEDGKSKVVAEFEADPSRVLPSDFTLSDI